MTFPKFFVDVMLNPTHGYRRGQYCINFLYMHRPDLASRLVLDHIELNPFHDDNKIPHFLIWVGENW